MLRRVFLAAGALGVLSAGALAAAPLSDFRGRIRRARAWAAQSQRYEQQGNAGAILIVGDSTARGTGAQAPERSLAGRIGAALPDLRIVNRGENGARFADVVEQLQRAPALPYRFVLIVAGANDVLRLTPPARVAQDVHAALDHAFQLSERVVLMALPNIGHAPILPWPLNDWYTRQARRVHERVRVAAAQQAVPLVNLFFEGVDDPFAREPQRYIADDGMHPSDEGYRLWFQTLANAQPALLQTDARDNLRNDLRNYRGNVARAGFAARN
jgi:lysophospholipase L1-like esterase